MRKEYLRGEPVETIYFGGGTPSQLAEEDFRGHWLKSDADDYNGINSFPDFKVGEQG